MPGLDKIGFRDNKENKEIENDTIYHKFRCDLDLQTNQQRQKCMSMLANKHVSLSPLPLGPRRAVEGRASGMSGIGLETNKCVCYNFNCIITIFKCHTCVIIICFSVIGRLV